METRLKRPVRRHNFKDDVNTLKTNQKMPVGKRDIINFYFLTKRRRIKKKKTPTQEPIEYHPQKLLAGIMFSNATLKQRKILVRRPINYYQVKS